MMLNKDDLDVTEKSFGETGSGEEESDDSGIPLEYRGTAADKRDMITLGKKQVLRVCILFDFV